MDMPKTNTRPRVIIIGASFAGLKAACHLSDKYGVTVIDKSPWFEFLPNIHELISGMKTPDMLRFSNQAIVRRGGHQYLYDAVTEILPEKSQVRTRRGPNLPYDFCIICAGSTINTYGVPGADRYALPFKQVSDCHAIHRRLNRLARIRKEFFINIVGGGLEGVEALGEILRRFRRHQGLRARIIERQETLLSDAPADIESVVKKHCRHYAVEFLTGESVREISADAVTLSSGSQIKSDATLWTAGIKPCPFLTASGLPGKSDQWVPVNEYLQHPVYDNIFAAGDAAELPDPLSKQAYHAIDMGAASAGNLIRQSTGQPLISFTPAAKPMLVSFGDLDAFLIAGKTVIAGAALGALKEAVFQMVMTEFDQTDLWQKAFHLSTRARISGMKIIWPFLRSPSAMLRLGKIRLLRKSPPQKTTSQLKNREFIFSKRGALNSDGR
jgi:NADH dehydrogenase